MVSIRTPAALPALKATHSHLMGSEGVLSSIGLVTLVVDLKQKLGEDHGLSVILADELAMSQRGSPFRTGPLEKQYHVRCLRLEPA